jgi:hypothetical protein
MADRETYSNSMSLPTLADHLLTLGVNHSFLSLFFFAVALPLISVFLAFRFFG